MDNTQLWEKILEYIKERVSEVSYKLWIEPIQFNGIDDNGKINLTFKNALTENVVTKHYQALLQEAFLFATGEKILIS